MVGTSGSGKSSLVRAGLLPVLLGERGLDGERRWVHAVTLPGDRPIAALADALACLDQPPAGVPDPFRDARRTSIEALLREASSGLRDAVARSRAAAGRSLVLVVDQFEELFKFVDEATGPARAAREEEAAAYVALLLEAARPSTSSRVSVLLTMRSDYLGDCNRFAGLAEAVSASQFLVPRLTRDQRREAMELPLAKAAGSIEPELVQRLLNDTGDDPDQLPVLQHALMCMWIKAPDRRLGVNTYRDVGRLDGALSQHADAILREIGTMAPDAEAATARLLKALTSLDAEGRGTRRRRTFAELIDETGQGEELLGRVYRPAARARLLVPQRQAGGAARTRLPRRHLARGADPAVAPAGRRARDPRLAAGGGRGRRHLPHPAPLRPHLRRAAGRAAVRAADGGLRRVVGPAGRTEAWAVRYGGGLAEVDALLGPAGRRCLRTAMHGRETRAGRRRLRLAAAHRHPDRRYLLIIAGLAFFLYPREHPSRRSRAAADAAHAAARKADNAAREAISAARRGSMMLFARADELADGKNGRLASLLAMEALPEHPEVTPNLWCQARYRR